jgi:GNAT superfamily N-acetyltransferase
MTDASPAVTIVVEPEPAELTKGIVFTGLRAFNRQHAEPPDFERLTLAARDETGAVIGGLVGETGWRWLHIDLLWVEESKRGRGVGRSLLRAAEIEALHRGCSHVYLDTMDYQARPFYEAEGYGVFGVQDDYPPGHRRYFLRKTIAEPGTGGA